MPLHPTLSDIALRLVLTIAAGLLIGFNRGERGHAAGLRTTTLLCLAASVSMIQMNLLLPVSGKQPESFSNMDVMRLPLGILSGVGFIGAGAILRKGDMVIGVTTAATLWAITVIGLCLGAGQIGLGVVATLLVWIILCLLHQFDLMIEREQKGTLVLQVSPDVDIEPSLRSILGAASVETSFVSGRYDKDSAWVELSYEVRWRGRNRAAEPRTVVDALLALEGVHCVSWNGIM